jgi:hypothetical protein
MNPMGQMGQMNPMIPMQGQHNPNLLMNNNPMYQQTKTQQSVNVPSMNMPHQANPMMSSQNISGLNQNPQFAFGDTQKQEKTKIDDFANVVQQSLNISSFLNNPNVQRQIDVVKNNNPALANVLNMISGLGKKDTSQQESKDPRVRKRK